MKILQFTDTHLFKHERAHLCGMNTFDSLTAVVEAARASSHWPPDLILATGDLSQDESEESYQRFLNVFEPLNIPVFCLPGNHDNPPKLESVLATENVVTTRQILTDAWQILMLDSTVYRQNGGFLRQDELNFLDQCLSVHEDVPTLVCLHHNVLPTNTSWLDTMTVKNADEFFAVLKDHSNVKVVVTGHIHQDSTHEFGGVPIYGTPSTCIQFKPGTPTFTLDSLNPGYRWLDLNANGVIKTGVERVKRFDFTPDLKARGY